MTESKSHHDALFKWTFSEPERAAAELGAVLPPELLRLVDLSSLELCAGEFVDEALAHCYSDLLFQVQAAGRPGYVYVLFEHQSSADAVMPLRLLGYLLRVLELEVRTRRERREALLPLPVVIPVVLHHAERGWSLARRFDELFDAELMTHPVLAALVPRFEFLLDDLTHLSDEDLQRRALGHVTSLALWALRDARSPAQIVRTARAWTRAIAELQRAPHGMEALRVILRYILLVTEDAAAERVLEIVAAEVPENEEVMTLAERWKAEGRVEGKAEGRVEGQRQLLLRLLSVKFGELPDAVTARIGAATEPELSRWSEAVLTAASLDAVLSGDD